MLSYFQAIVIGLVQGVTELFPISSLGHSVLIPAWLGWHKIVGAQSEVNPIAEEVEGPVLRQIPIPPLLPGELAFHHLDFCAHLTNTRLQPGGVRNTERPAA